MQRIIVLLIVAALGWYGYTKYQERVRTQRPFGAPAQSEKAQAEKAQAETLLKPQRSSDSSLKCDGRTHCSQMTSCAEATFFLKNCPGTKMDGNNDGIPCESQWRKWKFAVASWAQGLGHPKRASRHKAPWNPSFLKP